jgi:hypothetical protein
MTDKTEEKAMGELMTLVAATDPAAAPRDLYEVTVSKWRAMRTKRLELNRLMEAAQKQETLLKSYAIEVFRAQKLEGVMIDGRITSLNTKSVATVSDKEALLNFIKETGDTALLQFRLATGTVDEYYSNDKKVPGVEYIDVYDLSDKKT